MLYQFPTTFVLPEREIQNNFLHLHRQKQSANSKGTRKQASSCFKKVLEAGKLAYASNSRFYRIAETWLYWQIAMSILNKCTLAVYFLFNSFDIFSLIFMILILMTYLCPHLKLIWKRITLYNPLNRYKGYSCSWFLEVVGSSMYSSGGSKKLGSSFAL